MKQYWQIISWLATDILRIFRKRVMLIQLFELASVGFGYAIGGVVFSVFYILENGSATLRGRTFEFEPSNANLIILFGFVGTLFVLQAICSFLSEILINRVCRNYEEHNVVRAFEKINQLGVREAANLSYAFNRRSASKLINTDARSCAIAQRMLLRSVVPLFGMLVAVAILLSINPLAVIGLLVFALIFGPAITFLGKRAVNISRNFEQYAGQAALAKNRHLEKISLRSGQSENGNGEFANIPADPGVKSFMKLYEQRFNIISQTGVVGGGISAAAAAIITGIFAWQAIKGVVPWSFVILNFIALQYILQAIKRVSTLIISLNRFFHQISRFYLLMKTRISPEDKENRVDLPVSVEFVADDGKSRSLKLREGGRSFIVSGERMDRFMIFGFINAMGFSDNPDISALSESIFVTQSSAAAVPEQGDQNGNGSEAVHEKTKLIIGILEALSNDPKSAQSADGDQNQTTETLPSDTREFVAAAVAASQNNRGVVFLDQKGLVNFNRDQAEALLSIFSDAHLFVVALKTVQPAKMWGIDEYIIFNGHKIVDTFTADWILENRSKLAELTKLIAKGSGDANTGTVDDELGADVMM